MDRAGEYFEAIGMQVLRLEIMGYVCDRWKPCGARAHAHPRQGHRHHRRRDDSIIYSAGMLGAAWAHS